MQRLEDLPVSIDLPTALAAEVAAYVETEGGWQVVGADGPPPPVLSVTATPSGGPCVVVTDGAAAVTTVAEALRAGALDVVAWPQERQRLLAAPLRVVRAPSVAATAEIVSVAGAGGGVGTSTVALAIAGMTAWSGARVAVVGGDDMLALAGLPPWNGPGAAQLAALDWADAAAEVASVVQAVPGVGGLTVLGGGPAPLTFDGWPFDVVVVEHGDPAMVLASAGLGLVVADRTNALRAAAAVGAPVVLRDRGAFPLPHARRLLRERLAGVLPESSRVARAGLAGRVPSSLPGSWLAGLRRIVRAVPA